MTRGPRLVAVVALAGLVSVVAGCGRAGAPDPPPPSVAPSSPAVPEVSLSPEDAEAAEEILAAFDEYMAAYIELSRRGVSGDSEEALERLEDVPVAGDVALALRYHLLTPNQEAGRATAGELTWVAAVMSIHWDFTPPLGGGVTVPLATLQVCFDESNWTTVDADSGEVVEGPRGRYRSTVTAVRLDPEMSDGGVPGEGWYINSRTDVNEPC